MLELINEIDREKLFYVETELKTNEIRKKVSKKKYDDNSKLPGFLLLLGQLYANSFSVARLIANQNQRSIPSFAHKKSSVSSFSEIQEKKPQGN